MNVDIGWIYILFYRYIYILPNTEKWNILKFHFDFISSSFLFGCSEKKRSYFEARMKGFYEYLKFRNGFILASISEAKMKFLFHYSFAKFWAKLRCKNLFGIASKWFRSKPKRNQKFFFEMVSEFLLGILNL